MSRTRVTSTSGVQSLRSVRSYNLTNGHFLTRRYKGTEEECQLALQAFVDAGGVREANIEEDAGGYFILSISYSTESATGSGLVESASAVTTIWSREQLRTEKTLWTSTPWITLTDAIPLTEHRVGLRLAIEDYLSGQTTWDIFSSAVSEIGSQSGTGITVANETISQLVDHYRKGIEYYNVQGWVFRRTQTGPLTYLQNDDANILKVWTRASFVAQSTMKAAFVTRIPATGYFLQSGATYTQLDDFRWQSVQDWEYGTEFSQWIYGNAI